MQLDTGTDTYLICCLLLGLQYIIHVYMKSFNISAGACFINIIIYKTN